MPRLIAFATCFFWMAVHLLAALAALPMPATRQAALVELFEVALWRGQLVEAALGGEAGSAAGPDFPHLGVELDDPGGRPAGGGDQ